MGADFLKKQLDEHVKVPYPLFCVWSSDVQEV